MANSGSVEIIQSWVEAFSDKLYSWALYKTNNKETAEDLVQETFLAACESLKKFEGKSEPQTWLFGILNHKIADYFRKIYRNPILNNPGKDTTFINNFFDENGDWLKKERPQSWGDEGQNLLDDHQFVQLLQVCLKELPDSWFAAINLKFLEQKKGDEICQELRLTATNYWQILHRAKLQLRKCLELKWFKKY